MKGKLSASGAKALREKNLAFGSNMLARVSAMAPDLDPSQVGSVLGDALSGPEGIRRLVTEFNLSKSSKTVAAANEKGGVFKLLTDAEKKKYNITKQGQYMEQGDLVDVLLSRSGMTDEAAEARRRKMDFQIKSIGATAENALSDIGAKAFDKFNNGMGKGATLAEKFENALKSDKGKEILESMSTAAAGVADGMVKVATALPAIGSFFSEHSTLLKIVAGGAVGLKAASWLGGELKPTGGGLGGLLGGGAGTPVFVTNMPGGGLGGLGGAGGLADKAKGLGGLATAGTAASGLFLAAAGAVAAYGGYKAGEYLGKHNKTIGGMHDSMANTLYDLTGEGEADKKLEYAETSRFANKLHGADLARRGLVAALETQGMDHGHAVYAAQQAMNKKAPEMVQVSTVINLDGKPLAKVMTEHQARDMSNRTAGGAAPRHGE